MYRVGDRLDNGPIRACLENVLLATGIVTCCLRRAEDLLAMARDTAQHVSLTAAVSLCPVAVAPTPCISALILASLAKEDWSKGR
jgi:hypothetical protein